MPRINNPKVTSDTKAAVIRLAAQTNPKLRYVDISAQTGVPMGTLGNLLRKAQKAGHAKPRAAVYQPPAGRPGIRFPGED